MEQQRDDPNAYDYCESCGNSAWQGVFRKICTDDGRHVTSCNDEACYAGLNWYIQSNLMIPYYGVCQEDVYNAGLNILSSRRRRYAPLK
jgi:hypothetical protein